jgi:hypothetical protein
MFLVYRNLTERSDATGGCDAATERGFNGNRVNMAELL